jgi:hypothetical protein
MIVLGISFLSVLTLIVSAIDWHKGPSGHFVPVVQPNRPYLWDMEIK